MISWEVGKNSTKQAKRKNERKKGKEALHNETDPE